MPLKFKSLIPFSSQPKDSLVLLQRDINKLFEEAWRGSPLSSLMSSSEYFIQPTMDISETDNEYVVTAEMPGVEKKNISVELTDNVLTIKGEKKLDRTEKNKDYHLTERISGSFNRSFELPQFVDFAQAKATFNEGVLTVNLPKSKEERSKKTQISIS